MKNVQNTIIFIIAGFSILGQAAKPQFDITGKVALITGGVGGIGTWYARELLRNGLEVAVLLDKNDTNSANIIKGLENEFGIGRAFFIHTDVTHTQQLEDSFNFAAHRFKHLDIIINNAGILNEDNGTLLAETNFVAVVAGTQLAFNKILPKFKKGREGVVVNTASVAGLVGTALFPIYSATKAGMVMMGRMLGHSHYYDVNNIKILTLCPGFTDTPLVQYYASHRTPFIDEATYNTFDRMQQPKYVGKALVKMLQEGQTGDIWVVENSKPAKKMDLTLVDTILGMQILSP